MGIIPIHLFGCMVRDALLWWFILLSMHTHSLCRLHWCGPATWLSCCHVVAQWWQPLWLELWQPRWLRCWVHWGSAVAARWPCCGPGWPSMELRRGMGGMRWRSVYRTPLENLRQIYVGYICRQRIMRNGPRHTRRLKDIRRWNVTTIKVSLLNTRR